MDLVIWGIFITLFLIVFFILYFFDRKRMKQKDSRINDLINSLSNLEKKLKGLERRKSYRFRLTSEQPCLFEIIEVGDRVLEKLKHRKGEGKIIDISSTGLKLMYDVDLPVRKKLTLKIDFKLQKEQFSFKGIVVRKKEEINGQINYGIQFVDIDSREQQRLSLAIHRLEVQRRRA